MTHDIVSVIWEDASHNNTWHTIEDAMNMKPYIVTTLGHLLKRDKKCVVVTQSISDRNTISDTMRVPVGMIRSVKVLKRGKK